MSSRCFLLALASTPSAVGSGLCKAAALEHVNADPSEAIMLGDTVWDVQAGRRAGVPTAAVLSGGITRDALEDAAPAAIYAGPLEVRARLEEFSQLLGR
jgi:phosphoglycolate phosphatase-like HAD superfamily hydrolase